MIYCPVEGEPVKEDHVAGEIGQTTRDARAVPMLEGDLDMPSPHLSIHLYRPGYPSMTTRYACHTAPNPIQPLESDFAKSLQDDKGNESSCVILTRNNALQKMRCSEGDKRTIGR